MSNAPRSAEVRRSWGTDDTGCHVLHVDMDAFFASVELVRRPELRGLPVIVGGSGRSVVLSATYEARAFGVRSAMPMARARALCPQAVVVPPGRAAYTDVSRAVMDLFREVTPVVEQVSVDEAFLDVSGARRRLGGPAEIGARLRDRVQREQGITCSVGIASTKHVAKLASTHAKPDGMLLVPHDATVPFLHALPVGALWGVGERTAERLRALGIDTVAQLAETDLARLVSVVGAAHGRHLHDLAWGRDGRAVETERTERSVGAERTYEVDERDRSRVGLTVLELADRCAARLRSGGLVGRVVSLKVRTDDFRTFTRSRSLASPADTAHEIAVVARELLAAAELGGRPVRLVGVRVEGLEPRAAAALQPTLDDAFAEVTVTARAAEEALDAVRARFGASAVRRASTVGRSTTTTRGGDLS
ncbi:DNA polymerase IV [Luteimicrobium subarcticum]|uniref:DNA polymerase IV n=1 Tax=Luteimicrobium subarcticum TaxID=620910 RepID=A0A2M8WTT1_9MICO|nr:DNA polymerase IV [Luteimicrobium subarcticum]PJI94351.1 DNA polymerase-4 [Luteimicrobium subarcticum]